MKMTIKETVEKITKHSKNIADSIKDKEIKKIEKIIKNSRSIFITGKGRSGLIGKAFAMRLAQLGLNVHVTGDVTTTAIKEGDCLIIISSSGTMDCMTSKLLGKLKDNFNTILLTANRDSELANSSNVIIDIGPWRDYGEEIQAGREDNITPLGTLYEDTALLILDGLVAELMEHYNKTEKDLAKKHF